MATSNELYYGRNALRVVSRSFYLFAFIRSLCCIRVIIRFFWMSLSLDFAESALPCVCRKNSYGTKQRKKLTRIA